MDGEEIYIIKMKIRIYLEFIESNKYVFYKVINKKKKKVNSGYFLNDNTIELLSEGISDEYILVVYPKYYSKLKWFLVWVFLGLIELIASSFGSFGSDSKMYKAFYIKLKNECDEINLNFNNARFELTCLDNCCEIREEIRGRLYSILVSLLGLSIFICLIAIIVCIRVYIKND